jgi:protein-disulfide isomerase
MSAEEINALIEDYILHHPEILIASLESLQNKKAKDVTKLAEAFIKNNLTKLQKENNPPVLGDQKSDFTIISFFDYNCSYCKKAYIEDKRLLASDKNIKVILRPLAILGEDSLYAAKAALAFLRIDRENFTKIHDEMMQIKRINKETLVPLLKKYKIDEKLFANEVNSYDVKKTLDRNFSFAKELGIKGTPSYIIGDKFIPGFLAMEKLQQLINYLRNDQSKP